MEFRKDFRYVENSKIYGHGMGVTEKEREYLREKDVYSQGEIINFVGYIHNRNLEGYCNFLKRKNKNEE